MRIKTIDLVTAIILCVSPIISLAASVTYTLDFNNIHPARPLNVNFGALPMAGSNYGGFKWGNGWFATSEGIQDTYLSTTNNSLLISRNDGQDFQLESFEYWSRGGEQSRKFFVILYDNDSNVLYNSDDDAKLKMDFAHQTFDVPFDGLINAMAIGFTNGGDNDGWRYLGVDDFKFSIDETAIVNTNIVGFNVEENLSPVPVPAAAWLFASSLFGIAGFRRNCKIS